jgi:hypothetical protein
MRATTHYYYRELAESSSSLMTMRERFLAMKRQVKTRAKDKIRSRWVWGDFSQRIKACPSVIDTRRRVQSEAKCKVPRLGDKLDSGTGLRSTLACCPIPTVHVLESSLE